MCSGCRQARERYHDREKRWVRDPPIPDAQTYLLLRRFRVECPTRGPKLEWLSRPLPRSRVTLRPAKSVARLCRVLPIKHVAEFYGLSWDAVKAIDKQWLERTLGEPDLSNLTRLAMDEFAIRRGRRYATIFVQPNRKQVLWVCRRTRWLLRNGPKLKRHDRVRLPELLAANRRLAAVYVRKDDWKALWDYRLPGIA